MKEMQAFSSEYASAVSLFTHMDHLRRVWAGFHPMPPLKRSDLAVLGTIDQLMHSGEKNVTVSMLARALHQSLPGVSQKVSVLEDFGYLKRTGDKADRRVTYVALTPKGKKTAQTSLREFLGRMEQALNSMGAEKTGQMLELMEELTEAIKNVRQQEKK